MCNTKIKRYELVELTISATVAGRFNFDTIPQLRNSANQLIVIKGIDVFTSSEYANSQFNAAVPGIAPTDLKKAVLVLYTDGEEAVHYIPLHKLYNMASNATAGVPYNNTYVSFDSLTNVDWDKSYIQFATAPAAQCVVPFGITYLRLQRGNDGNFSQF